MKYYRPKQELRGKRLSASTVASFMAAQSVGDAKLIRADVSMPAILLRFLMRERAIEYWTSPENAWLKIDSDKLNFTLTEKGIRKIHDRLSGRAKAQNVTQQSVMDELQIILRGATEDSLDSFEYPVQITTSPISDSALELRLYGDEIERITSVEAHTLWPDELPEGQAYWEGLAQQVLVNRYERCALARAACIAHFGAVCQVCKLDFGERYGRLGVGFIHVHHLRELSTLGANYQINPIVDLIPVCPNCHAMLHRCDPPLRVERLRALLVTK